MSYEPLHHKYRPQTFAELVGQGAIATTLSNALRQQRIAPAYLFTGPRGTGKTSSARILAKSLNCIAAEVPTAAPCGQCDVCRSIIRGAALDVIEIDAASNTGVDNIRELIERAQFAPVQCRFKVYVIDEVHMLSVAAFNALLKTLEEPPDRVVFVLATTDPQKVLPTIISRCQRFDFRRIPLEDMVQHLGAIAAKEAIEIAPEALHLVAQIAQGGLRDAESLLDQLSLLDGEITVERVWDLVGAVPERDLLALVRAIAQDDAAAVLDQARHLMNRGREPLIVLQNLASFYRDLLIAKTARDRNDLVAITPQTWAELCDFVQTVDLVTILAGQQHLRTSEVQVKNTTQPRLWLEVILMGLLPSSLSQVSASGQVASGQSSSATPRHLPQRPPVEGRSPHSVPPVRSPAESPAGAATVASAKTSPAPSLPAPQPPAKSSPATSPASPAVPTTAAVPSSESLPEQASQGGQEPSDSSPVPVSDADDPALPAEEAIAPPAEPAAETQPDLGQIWQEVLSLVQPFSTQTLLRQQCHLIALMPREARIGIHSKPLFKIAKDRLPNVEAAFAEYFGRPIKVHLEVSTAVAAVGQSAAGQSPSAQRGSNGAAPPPTQSAPPSPSPSTPASASPSPPPVSVPPPSQGNASVPQQPPAGRDRPATPSPPPVPNDAAGAPPVPSSVPSSAPAPPSIDAAMPLGVWEGEDDVTKAAKSLAQMFNGQVVSLDDDSISIPTTGPASFDPALESELEIEVDDEVPF